MQPQDKTAYDVPATELQKCPRCWQAAVNMTAPAGYKYRVCQGCGHVVPEREAERAE